MYCRKCGKELEEGARFCSSCGFDQQSDSVSRNTLQAVRKPDNYLWLGVLVTVLCCLPFGIVSILNSSKVDSCWAAGDLEGAIMNASKAKSWALWGIGVSVAVWILYIIVLVLVYWIAPDTVEHSFISTGGCRFI